MIGVSGGSKNVPYIGVSGRGFFPYFDVIGSRKAPTLLSMEEKIHAVVSFGEGKPLRLVSVGTGMPPNSVSVGEGKPFTLLSVGVGMTLTCESVEVVIPLKLVSV